MLRVKVPSNSNYLNDPNQTDVELNRFYAIDTRPFPINLQSRVGYENAQKYKEKVSEFIEDVLRQLQEVMLSKCTSSKDINIRFSSISRITEFIESFTAVKLTGMSQVYLMIGIVQGCINIANFGSSRIKQLFEGVWNFVDDND